MDTTSLGDRMKSYEKISQTKLISRMPVIIRLDGKAFHTYTRKCDRPFDEDLHLLRQDTLNYLCQNIQGCILGYSQSDEITLVLKDWESFKTSSWFGNKVQKICSITASMCTAFWNLSSAEIDGNRTEGSDKFHSMALFDSRCFNIPKEEVVNCLIWRQQDWERNSVQLLAQSLYSHKQLQNKSCAQLITKIEQEHGIIWGELEDWKKRGEFWFNGEIQKTPRFKDFREEIEDVLNYTTGE